jgi:predicted RNA-binding Zn ribbon-like protein
MKERKAALPPFRTLDPALAAAERLLGSGEPRLSTVVRLLPDERAAAAALNDVLAACGASPRLRATGDVWRVVHVATEGRDTDLVAAACGVAALVEVAGWRRFKECATCGQPFVDRTNGSTRRWCTPHRPRVTPLARDRK